MSESRGPNDAQPTFPGANPPAGGGATPPGGPGRPAAARPGGQGLTLLALGVAGLALLLAFGSAVFAWRAIDQAEDAKAIALKPATVGDRAPATGPAGGQPTESAPAGADSATPDDTPRSPGEAPPLDAQTVYRPRYEKQMLVLKASCSYSMYADLDEPRTQNDENGADIRFTRGCGNDPSTLRLEEGVEGTDAAGPGMTPQECADKIRTVLIGENQRVPVRKGTAICITTDYSDAKAHGRPWRMALVEVVAVANDGAATLQVTGWDIPDA
ncbi:hypothetical protein ACL02O_09290 [Micromonospora sp. MS34]|uniref:hypothetical protein n=1 Tax=Micromonospora sp. MS34 TaxID=3385971 RepID=UPI0039A316A0